MSHKTMFPALYKNCKNCSTLGLLIYGLTGGLGSLISTASSHALPLTSAEQKCARFAPVFRMEDEEIAWNMQKYGTIAPTQMRRLYESNDVRLAPQVQALCPGLDPYAMIGKYLYPHSTKLYEQLEQKRLRQEQQRLNRKAPNPYGIRREDTGE